MTIYTQKVSILKFKYLNNKPTKINYKFIFILEQLMMKGNIIN